MVTVTVCHPTAPSPAMSSTNPIHVEEDEEDDDDVIDEEQLDEYKEMLDQLGDFPDKVKINSLTMVAEDHADSRKSSQALYHAIREKLVSSPHHLLLPLVYLVDSILKNAKGQYIPVIAADAANWMPVVHAKLPDLLKPKLQKVWQTWNEFQVFPLDDWKKMGLCFQNVSAKAIGSSAAKVAGISRTKDGTLLLPKRLRTEMETILDEIQADVESELDKVSLERLADLNPDLLANIKKTAEDHLGSGGAPTAGVVERTYILETRSPSCIQQSKAWNESKFVVESDASKIVQGIAALVGAAGDEPHTARDAMAVTHTLSVASALSKMLQQSVSYWQSQQESTTKAEPVTRRPTAGVSAVDPSKFTNDGLKEKDPNVIGLLYEVGLPFVSTADGRRFATQMELSHHLDALFKRNQLEKSMARTEERDWYITSDAWCGIMTAEASKPVTPANVSDVSAAESEYDPATSTVPADEARESCVVCGINFKMFFDSDDGVYKYSNCREIVVINDDDVALNESEDALVHVTCWQGLGSPDELTSDQAIQETARH